MKHNAFTAAVNPASDNGGGERHTPSNPTRVGQQFKSVILVIAVIICTLLAGCAGRIPNRPMSLPIEEVVQIETQCGSNPRAIEQEITRRGYNVQVSGSPGRFNYNWIAPVGPPPAYRSFGHPAPYGTGCVGGNYQPPNYQPTGWYPGNYHQQPLGDSGSGPWYGGGGGFRYVYADPETEYRHQNNIHIGPGARNYGH